MRTPGRINVFRGFTLVEMLVVVGVIVVLVGLIVPAVASFRAEADSTGCLNNLRQLFTAVETRRSQNKDILPYTQPLPAATPTGPIGGLNEALKGIIPPASTVHFCPGDSSPDSQEIGTSYSYVAGAFMLLEPPDLSVSIQANIERAARLVTQRFEGGYLLRVPIIADSEERHDHGTRLPRNVVFISGEARALKPGDGKIISGSDAPAAGDGS